MDSAILDRLLASGEPWVVYNALVDLAGEPHKSERVQAAYKQMQERPEVAGLIAALDTWPEKALSKAYNPKDAIWKLSVLADFGLRKDDPRIEAIAERVFAAQAEDGGFLHGGFDHTKSWNARPYICISHVMTYALARFGYLEDPRLQHAYAQLERWQRLDGGWHPNALNLPGNARENEPSCPFGTVNVLRAVLADPHLRDSNPAHRAAEYLLECWARREEPFRPVGFGIGTTWDKVQFPFVQYGLLKTVDTLSLVKNIGKNELYGQMLAHLKSKATPTGDWMPESVNKPYSEFSFGQKKFSSDWITFLVLRALERAEKK